jgi:hypothetical protein
MDNTIVPAASRELQTANADQVSAMTTDVLELDRGLKENNTELSLLNEALDGLDKTLRRNRALKSTVRSSMQKIITKL